MFEYDWEAMAARIEDGRAPLPLAQVLKGLYELGVRHGGGWSGDDEIERIGVALRKDARDRGAASDE